MSRLSIWAVLAAILVLFFLATGSLFIVDQTEQALVLQFGQPVREIHKPGLWAKLPLIQSAVLYDRRLLDYEVPAEEVIAADQKRIMIDCYTRYRIVDPLQFYRSVGSEAVMQRRLGATISASLRRVVGGIPLAKLLSPDRAVIMGDIRDEVRDLSKPFGIDVMDVRIRHADLPRENSEAIYQRMQSERQREAKQYRAEGYEAAQGIRAAADRDRTVILADAQAQSQALRGAGDAESIKIYAAAFGQDPGFFAFYRSLQAYRSALETGTTFVVTPDSEFFRFFQHPNGAMPPPPPGREGHAERERR